MQIDSAIHYIQLLEPLLIGLNNEYLAEHQMTLGWIFQRSRMTQEAIKAYRTAAKYFLKNSMLEKAAWAYFDVVLCHDDAQEYQQAIDALTRCDSINNAIHSLDYLWPITACRAILLSQLDRHQEALGFYEKSFVLAEELGTEFCCGNKVFYALSKLNLGQHEGLREIIDEARVKVEEVEFPREKSVIYKAIYQSYEALGDDSLALIYHKLYTKELESVSHLDYQVTLARMEAEKEMLQLKQELVSLDSKLEKENSRNISYRWIGVLAALVILLLTYLLYRWRMYKRYYEYDQQGWRRLKEDLSDKGMSKSEETILQIEKYIYDNCGRQQLSGRMIQKELGLSTRTINEILKTHLNTHISQFINIVRIRKAQEIMLNTDLTISEIAYDVGYTDPAYFSRLFKRLTEESPSKWRCERGSEI
jgi:AraC-like DNA-binding protein